MEITGELSEKEIVRQTLMEIKRLNYGASIHNVCPFNSKNNCKLQCYKIFKWWEILRFIINVSPCPCKVLSESVVHDRTWEWINGGNGQKTVKNG